MSLQADPDFLSNEEYGDPEGLDIRNNIQARYRTNPRSWFRWVFDVLSFPDGARLLELGCGSGLLWIENPAWLSRGWRLSLADLSPGMVAEARQRIGPPQPEAVSQAFYAVVNAEAIPFEAAQFDGILALGLLDHLPDPTKTLDEVFRLLKPAGCFVTSAGGSSHLQEIDQVVAPFLSGVNFGGDPGRFGLDNGSRLLSPWFPGLQLLRYDDTLVFDRPEPLLAYILSEAQARSSLDKAQWAALRGKIEATLEARGEIRVTTSKGLFTGIKPVLD